MAVQSKEIMKLCSGFQASRVILTANNLGVFDQLNKRSQEADALARTLGTDRRATGLLLDALVSLGLLVKQGSKYRNSTLSSRYLLKGTPEYQGDIIRHLDSIWHNWTSLDEVMVTGRPPGRGFDHQSFILGMHNLASLRIKEVMRAMKLESVKKALDLGCGPGTYAMEMAGKGISITMFDLPETIKIAKKLAASQRVKGIRYLEGDFNTDGIGVGYDLIFMSHILHAYGEDENKALLSKCYAAMNPNGRLVIQEMPINKNRTRPPQGALFAINMLVNTEAGRTYSAEEIEKWLAEADFVKVVTKPLSETVLIEGQKAEKPRLGGPGPSVRGTASP